MSTWTPGREVSSLSPSTGMEDRVEALIQRGKDVVEKQVQLDMDGQKKDIGSP